MGINEVDGLFSDEELKPLLFNHLRPIHVEDDSRGRILHPWRSNALGVIGRDNEEDLVFVPRSQIEIIWQEGEKKED